MDIKIVELKFVPFLLFVLSIFFLSCNKKDINFDASGTFESTEIIVSAEGNGKVVMFDKKESDEVSAGELVVQIDTTALVIQAEQAEATMIAIDQKRNSAAPQVMVLRQQLKVSDAQVDALNQQLKVLEVEQKRMKDLFEGHAATGQHLDDINGKVDVLQKQIYSAKQQNKLIATQIQSANDQVAIQNAAIVSEKGPMEKKVDQVKDMLRRSAVFAPINGVLLSKYVEKGEFVTMGKPLFKLADLSEMSLHAYITGDQLPSLKIGQEVTVYVDSSKDEYIPYKGRITAISNKAEFTPKTIQTKEERANLVYAIKIAVKNDGMIKIGMYGEVAFNLVTAEQ